MDATACRWKLYAALVMLARPAGAEPWGVDLIRAGQPAERLENDYAAALGDAWDFDEGDRDGLTEVGPGIENLTVAGGELRFRVNDGPEAWLVWDPARAGPPDRALRFGWNWDRMGHSAWAVEVRLRQAASESEVTLETADGKTTTRKLTGDAPQTVRFGSYWFRYCIDPRIKLTFKGANAIAIDAIRVGQVSEQVTFRGSFQIPGEVHSARGWVLAEPGATVFVNGQERLRYAAATAGWRPHTVDLKPALRPGRNVVVVERELLSWGGLRNDSLALGVRIVLADGRLLRLTTGPGWKVKPFAGEAARRLDYDDSEWPVTKSGGDVATPRVEGDWAWIPKALADEGRSILPPFEIGALRADWDRLRPPLADLPDGLRLRFRLAPAGLSDSRRIRYRVLGPDGVTTVDEGALDKPVQRDGPEELYELVSRPREPGVYVVEATLVDGEQELERIEREAPLIGPPDQREVAPDQIDKSLDLRPVDRIDFADPGDPHEWIAFGKQQDRIRVVDTTAGPCLELPGVTHARSYRITVGDPAMPHLGVVTYADVGPQAVGISVAEVLGRRRVLHRAGTGFVAGWRQPPSGELRRFSFVFYGGRGELTAQFMNRQLGPARLRSFEVYDIVGGLPRPRVRDGGRTFGYQFERGGEVIPSSYYTGDGGWQTAVRLYDSPHSHLLRDWWNTWDNCYRHLRFMGHNAFGWMAWMYNNPMYDTASGLYDRNRYRVGLDLGLAMAEAYGLKVYLGHEWLGSRTLQERDIYTDTAVRAGADTLRAVAGDGSGQVYEGYFKEYKGFNLAHPDVEAEMVRNARELAARYARFPAVAGLSFSCGDYFGPCVYRGHRDADAYRFSYDDRSIAQFEAATGRRLGIDPAAPDRFERRYVELTGTHREAWTAWRCRRVAKTAQRIAAAVSDVDPRLECHFIWGEWAYGHLHTEAWSAGQLSYPTALARSGVDLDELRRRGLSTGLVQQLLGGLFSGRENGFRVYRGARLDPQAFGTGEGATPDVVYFHHPFAEYTFRGAPESWPWTTTNAFCYSCRPVGDDYALSYAQVFSHTVPETVFHGYTDCNAYSGGEADVRRIAVLLRGLPRGRFDPIQQTEAAEVAVLRHREGRVYLAVNPTPWPVTIRVDAGVVERSSGEPAGEIRLPAGGMVAIERVGGEGEPRLASEALDNPARRAFATEARAHLAGLGEGDPGAWAAELRRCLDQGHWLAAYRLRYSQVALAAAAR